MTRSGNAPADEQMITALAATASMAAMQQRSGYVVGYRQNSPGGEQFRLPTSEIGETGAGARPADDSRDVAVCFGVTDDDEFGQDAAPAGSGGLPCIAGKEEQVP